MHKLVDYICDELEELERKAEKDGKLSMAEVQYMDTLAHAKKNLLKGERMMEEDGYSMTATPMTRHYDDIDHSMAMGRKRDAMGRYSRRMSYADGMKSVVDSIYDVMGDLPESVQHDAKRLVRKIEETM